jgi:hypothetical protein
MALFERFEQASGTIGGTKRRRVGGTASGDCPDSTVNSVEPVFGCRHGWSRIESGPGAQPQDPQAPSPQRLHPPARSIRVGPVLCCAPSNSRVVPACPPRTPAAISQSRWRLDPLASRLLRGQPTVQGVAFSSSWGTCNGALLDKLTQEVASIDAFLDSQYRVLRAFISDQLVACTIHLGSISHEFYAVDVHHSRSPALHEALPF